MAKLSRRAFTRKKLTGTIDDYPLVKVTTLDWVSHSEWMHIDKARKLKPAECHSVGHLLTDSRAKVQIFGSYSYDEDGTMEVGTIETMPGSWVLRVVKNMKYLIIFLILVLLSVGLNAAADEDWTPEFKEFCGVYMKYGPSNDIMKEVNTKRKNLMLKG